MITEKRLEDALTFLSDTDETNAESNANVKYLDRLLLNSLTIGPFMNFPDSKDLIILRSIWSFIFSY